MKTVRFGVFGIPHEVAQCAEVEDVGEPADDEVVIEIEAFPINPADLLTLEGRYAVRPSLPATLGAEGVGRIVALGKSAAGLALGDRVINLGRDNWTQKRKIKAVQAIKVPTEGDVLQLAMLKVNPATALLMLRNYVELAPGDWIIQNAANSGVGTCLIRLAKAAGVRTVNVVRRESLVQTLSGLGADAVVMDGPDLAARVGEATGAAEIKLAIDAIAGEATLRLADCLAEAGTIVNYGLLSGQPCMLGGEHTVFKGLTLTGFWLAKVLTNTARPQVQALYDELLARLGDGTLHVPVEATYPIEEIRAALKHAGRAGRSGKILVAPNGPVG